MAVPFFTVGVSCWTLGFVMLLDAYLETKTGASLTLFGYIYVLFMIAFGASLIALAIDSWSKKK